MAPSKAGRCCQSVPRCRSCPVWRAADLIALQQLGKAGGEVPTHLAGVPNCLHKYEPLLREAWARREPGATGDEASAGEAVA